MVKVLVKATVEVKKFGIFSYVTFLHQLFDTLYLITSFFFHIYIGPAVYWYDSCPRCQVLAGVSSYGNENCGPSASPEENNGDRDSFYVDVFHYLRWIDETQRNHSALSKIDCKLYSLDLILI